MRPPSGGTLDTETMARENRGINPQRNPLRQPPPSRRQPDSNARRPTTTPPPNRALASPQAATSDAGRELPGRHSGSRNQLRTVRGDPSGNRPGVFGTKRRRAIIGSGLALAGVLVAAELISRSDRAPAADPGGSARADASSADRLTPPSSMVIVPDPSDAADGTRSPATALPSVDRAPLTPRGDGAEFQDAGPEASNSPTARPDSGLAGEPRPDWELLARSVVQLYSPDCEQVGSGTLIGDGSHVLTNSHVLHAGGEASGPLCEVNVGFTRSFAEPPTGWRPAAVVADDPVRDLALVRLASAPGDAHPPLEVVRGDLSLGDELTILGYPGFGQSQDTLTFTSGRFSGMTTDADGFDFYKTDALLDSGVSGGAVFDDRGQFSGVATGGVEGEGGHLGLVIPAAAVLRFLDANDPAP